MSAGLERLITTVRDLESRVDGAGMSSVARVITIIASKSVSRAEALGGLLIIADTSEGAITVTLPAATCRGVVTVKRVGPNGVTVQRSGTDLIDGATSVTLANSMSTVVLAANGSGAWYIVSKYL